MGQTRTTCPYCGVGCGVIAERGVDGAISVRGDADHPANFGRLCSKGSALAETLSLEDRLLHPTIAGERRSWDEALDHVAGRFSRAIAEHGPDSVAFYVSGQILTEDYYVANKLMKGFIGSANIDTNSRLCMASSVAGHRRAFGSDTVPGVYEDLEEADLVILVGSNLAWCHPVLFQRLEAARQRGGTRVVVVDPRQTATCAIADLHLALKPGSDVALFNGLLAAIAEAGAVDGDYIARHTSGFERALAEAASLPLAKVAEATGLSEAALREFYALFIGTPRVVTAFSQGVNQSTVGTDKVNAIINAHLATGRIGKPGMGPFSITGQPNAMGGREVGGLSNMLAAHMALENEAHRDLVQRFWGAPRIAAEAGLKAVDLFRAVADGRIKALWIMATNPVVSMPEADAVRAALQACPFVVVSDVARTDTTAHAHVLLPALAWGEKSGTVTNSERRISRQRAFLPAPGEARADWWQMAEVGQRMGFAEAFAYAGPHEVFAEYARLTGTENDGARDLDISAFGDVDEQAFEALEPFQWPRPAGGGEQARFFAKGGFFTPDRRGRFVATPYRVPLRQASADYPFVLNTGRIRDQWHTMTRTGKTPRLMGHIGEPFVEIHPVDAAAWGVAAADLAQISSPHGRIIARVLVTERQQRGSLFVPMHWTDDVAAMARVDALVDGDVDPVSGQPGLKQARAALKRFSADWQGLIVSACDLSLTACAYWAKARVPGGWRAEIAGHGEVEEAATLLRRLIKGAPEAGAEMIAYRDRESGQQRAALFCGEQLVAALFIAPEPVAVSRAWAADQLARPHPERLPLLAGRPGGAQRDRGAVVCACFDVGRNDILAAIVSGGCSTVAAVGAALQAGTNCGSCRVEIGRLIHDHAAVEPSAKAG